MFATRPIARTVPQLQKCVVQARSQGTMTSGVVVSPPRVRISFTEKLIHGAVFTIGVMVYPLYTLLDVRKARIAQWEAED